MRSVTVSICLSFHLSLHFVSPTQFLSSPLSLLSLTATFQALVNAPPSSFPGKYFFSFNRDSQKRKKITSCQEVLEDIKRNSVKVLNNDESNSERSVVELSWKVKEVSFEVT